MTRSVLDGLSGANPLGFMASLGLLRLLGKMPGYARLGFTEDGTFRAWIECDASLDIVDIIAGDAQRGTYPQPWRLEYEKAEKKGVKTVADLKAPPGVFVEFLTLAVSEWIDGRVERADYAASYGTDVAVDGNKNTKPTAFHFTAANQQLLGIVEEIRKCVTQDWVAESLNDQPGKMKPGSNLRWDPDAERSRALMSTDPSKEKTVVNAPIEWLAFRALPVFYCVPIGNRILTCGVTGQDELRFHWPLWKWGASYATARSLVSLTASWVEREEMIQRKLDRRLGSDQNQHIRSRLQRELKDSIESRRARGVFAVCTSAIRRSAQGYGNFGPAQVRA